MRESTFRDLEAVVTHEHFAEVDLMLRRGRHLGRDDGILYDYLTEALPFLEPFYQAFRCELVHRSDGYFYLLPIGDGLGRRLLSAGEMLVGQVLALLYLDPATLQHGGVIPRESLLQRLSGFFGAETLVRILNPQKRKFDERVAADEVRQQVQKALRRLADLGFIELFDQRKRSDDRLRLRSALMRFADPVRGLTDAGAALERLVQRGEVALAAQSKEPIPGDPDGEEAS
jgi:chromosome partition protein MukE